MTPHLSDELVELVPLALVPVEPLYEMALRGGGGLWRARGRTPNLDEFTLGLWGSAEACFAVSRRQAGGGVVGFVGLYGADVVARVGSISAFFDQRHPDAKTIAARSLRLFCAYAFRRLSYRKLLVESPSSMAGGLRRLAESSNAITLEGVLVAHTLVEGEFEDVQLFSVWAEPFLAEWQNQVRRRKGVSEDEVLEIIRDLSDFPPDRTLDGGYMLSDDLGFDSLMLAELIVQLEEAMGRPFPPTDGLDLSVRDVIDAVLRV
jgi:acyl carrier protein